MSIEQKIYYANRTKFRRYSTLTMKNEQKYFYESLEVVRSNVLSR
jgi:hypothetical protein